MSSVYAGYKVSILSATNATPIVVTTITNHGRSTGDEVFIEGTGNLADGLWTIVVLSASTFSLTGSTAPGSAVGGGSIVYYPPNYTIPSDGDVRDAASVNAAFEGLGDRTRLLSESLGRSGGPAVIGNSSGGVGGSVQLANNQFPQFPTVQSRTVCKPIPAPYGALPTGWITSSSSLLGPNTAQGLEFHISGMHDGATIDYIALRFRVTQAHTGVPSTLPEMSISRQQSTVGTALTGEFLSSSNPQQFTPTPANATAWVDGNNFQELRYTCNQHNIVDTSQYIYIVSLTDEFGTNSVNNSSAFSHLIIHYSSIGDMRWSA